MKLNIIVAVDEAGGFGKDGMIPWTIKEDMEHFRDTTKGAVCVMGRRTYEDMLAMRTKGNAGVISDQFELLPGRDCYVVSSNEELNPVGAVRVPDINTVIQKYKTTERQVFVLGGRRMFIEALAHKPAVHMTIIKGDSYSCDVSFPVEVLESYKIVSGKETEQCYYVEYRPA